MDPIVMDLIRRAERAAGMSEAEAEAPTEAAAEAPTGASEPLDPARIEGRADLAALLLAGDCRVTVVSPRTGARYTYRISAPRDDARGDARKAGRTRPCAKCNATGQTPWGACYRCDGTGQQGARGAGGGDGVRFVSVLTGPDNGQDYSYTGLVRGVGGPRPVYSHGGAKARIGADAPSARGIAWLLGRVLAGGSIAGECEIWHQSTCARCGHDLTDPESIARRFGPDCWEIMQGG